jgi:hypothetical protein
LMYHAAPKAACQDFELCHLFVHKEKATRSVLTTSLWGVAQASTWSPRRLGEVPRQPDNLPESGHGGAHQAGKRAFSSLLKCVFMRKKDVTTSPSTKEVKVAVYKSLVLQRCLSVLLCTAVRPGVLVAIASAIRDKLSIRGACTVRVYAVCAAST